MKRSATTNSIAPHVEDRGLLRFDAGPRHFDEWRGPRSASPLSDSKIGARRIHCWCRASLRRKEKRCVLVFHEEHQELGRGSVARVSCDHVHVIWLLVKRLAW